MPLTLVTSPDLFALTRGGRMLYRFSGSGRYESLGVKAGNSILIRPAHPILAGDEIHLTWNNQTVIMTARDNPSLPGEFPSGDGTAAYATSLLPYFKGYYPVRKDFEVTILPDPVLFSIIQLTAKQPGAAYTIAPYSAVDSLPVVGGFPAGGEPLIRERYGVYIEVYLQNPGTSGTEDAHYRLIGNGQHVEADEDGNMLYDVGDLIHGYLSADVPAFNSISGQLAQTSHRKYFIAYGEAWGNPIKPGLITQDTVRHAYLGGADFLHRASAGFSLANYIRGAASGQDRALRFGPAIRKVYVDEPVWLSFVNTRDDADAPVSLLITLTLDDDTTRSYQVAQATQLFLKGDKLTYPVGIGQLNLQAGLPQGAFIKEFSVALRSQAGNFYSTSYRFIVDYDQRPYRRFFAYQNSLGAFDCISTYGKGSRELQRFSDQAERILPAYYTPTSAQFVDYNLARQHSFEVASGWQELAELVRWDDFYCAYVRFLVAGAKALAISLTAKQIKLDKDGDNTFAHQFSYVYAHRDEYYSEDEQAQPVPVVVAPAGTVTVLPTETVQTRDPTIDDAVRTLTPVDILNFRTTAARPNPATLGFLTQQAGALLFRRHDTPISYLELSHKPTSRDEAGLGDVLTALETDQVAFQSILNTTGIRPFATSWTETIEPQ